MNKMYFFNPHDYGQNYHVLASSKEEALKFVIESDEYGSESFIGTTVDNLPDKYTIDEYELGKVLRTETS